MKVETTGFMHCELPVVVHKNATREEIVDDILSTCEASQMWDEVGWVENDDPDLVTVWRTNYIGDSTMESYPAYVRFVA